MGQIVNGQSIATNTLLMPNVPRCFFSHPGILQDVRAKFEDFGTLYAFVAMKGFARLMIIYEETECAMRAKRILDKTTLSWEETPDAITLISLGEGNDAGRSTFNDEQTMQVRLYFGQHNPINPDPSLSCLRVPESEKNFLISPPGSPCENWQQTRESPPNTAVLASDLMHAIADMPEDDLEDLENFRLDSPITSDDHDENDDVQLRPRKASRAPLLKVISSRNCDEEGGGEDNLPMITVQDWDGDGDTDSLAPPRLGFPKAKVVPTARPPLRT